MGNAGIGQVMIQRYAKLRRERLFRGNPPDGNEFVLLHDSARGHFPVYLNARGSSPADERLREEHRAPDERVREEHRAEAIQFCARWSARCTQNNSFRLHKCVKHFNDHKRSLTASVRESHDCSALSVIVNGRFWVRDDDDFRPVVRFLDMSLASAVKLFEFVYEELQAHTAAELQHSLPLTG